LLWRHIGDGADDGAGRSDQIFGEGAGVDACAGVLSRRDALSGCGHLGKAEVEEVGVAMGGDEDVRRLDVAMDDAFGVRRVEGMSSVDRDLQ
jgi:hypothetical protein